MQLCLVITNIDQTLYPIYVLPINLFVINFTLPVIA